MYEWRANALIRLCTCVDESESEHLSMLKDTFSLGMHHVLSQICSWHFPCSPVRIFAVKENENEYSFRGGNFVNSEKALKGKNLILRGLLLRGADSFPSGTTLFGKGLPQVNSYSFRGGTCQNCFCFPYERSLL